jgi:hypothetical protein
MAMINMALTELAIINMAIIERKYLSNMRE